MKRKPLYKDCEKLCDEFETCTKKDNVFAFCGRRKGSYGGTPRNIVMMKAQDSYKWNAIIKVRLYREVPDLLDNGNNMRKKRV